MDCSKSMVSLFLAEPKTNLPPKCMICKVALHSSVFERQLSPQDYERYTRIMLSLLWYKDCMKDNEELVHCGFCSYTEIQVKSFGSQFMFCKHKGCKKVSCLVCLHEVPKLAEDYDADEDDEYEENMEKIEKHFKCAELKESKNIFDKAMENGQQVACPVCGLAGMKDDACTHMTCPDCQTVWCYFCGLAESACDKSEDDDDLDETAAAIYRHNTDWEINPQRCPMYLTALQDIDKSWSNDEHECLEKFHRIRSLKYLHQAYEQLGANVFEQLEKQFGIISTCGFTLDDIKDGDLQLIDYGLLNEI
ncbi:unnamed protein product [Rotaria sp. Silwood2]|nr:unnamed protein product [Rotaria sp. Silwood2]